MGFSGIHLKIRLGLFAMSVVFSAATGLSFGGPALAQTSASPSGFVRAEKPSPAILERALAGQRGMPDLDQYLRGDGATSDVVARRATTLLRALGANRDRMRPQDLLNAVDTVTHVAARSLAYVPVMHLAIDKDYRPSSAVLAWDFGPADAPVMPGFERVAPDDSRISGIGVAALGRADENALLTDGVAGIRRISLGLPDGKYRVILMTQNFGVDSLVRHPFGQEIRINGVPLIVMRHGPPRWLHYALLAHNRAVSASGGLKRVRGYGAGDVGARVKTLLPAQAGGGIVVEGAAVQGKMTIELRGFDNTQSYLTGLIVEPLNQPSDLVLSDAALNRIMPLELRIALETEILLVAGEIVQGIAPAAGQAIEGDDVVTPN
jgi:hypothetical protein